MSNEDLFQLGEKTFTSRLLLGSGKFSSLQVMEEALRVAHAEIITMALRRIDLDDPFDQFMESIRQFSVLFLPNTSGARNDEEAVRLAELVRHATGNEWIKLEVTPDPKYLLPDPIATLKAAEKLVKQGFKVMPYINADPILSKRLEEIGCICVMPLGSPIGSNQGIKTLDQISIIIEQSNVPVIVDAGLGAPSHAALAMEIGADAVLVNTAIATAVRPELAAKAFRHAVLAGRDGYLSRLRIKKSIGQASSPLTGFLNS